MKICFPLLVISCMLISFLSTIAFAESNEVESLDSLGDVMNTLNQTFSSNYSNIDIISARIWDNESNIIFIIRVNGTIEDNASVVYTFEITSISNPQQIARVTYSNNYAYLYLPEKDIIPCESNVSSNTLTIFAKKNDLKLVERPWSIIVSAGKDIYKDTAAIASYTPIINGESHSNSTPGFVFVAIIFSLLIAILLKKRAR
jgi:hypothetical protein